jgi:hypothetical protein
MTMKSFRIAIAAAALATVSSVSFAADAHAGQMFGRDSVTAQGKTVATQSTTATRYAGVVPGRQGGLSADAKQNLTGKAHISADVVDRLGRA